jgi:hypothetical protein
MLISKSDFLLYLDAPLHLWAKKHNKIEQIVLSQFELNLMEQGNQIEDLAIEFLKEAICKQGDDFVLTRNKTFTQGHFFAEVDALVFDPRSNNYDVYEIKSSTGIKKEHKYDVTFQSLICKANFPLRNFYIVHLNKELVRDGDVQLDQLFIVECLDLETEKLENEVIIARDDAWRTVNRDSHDGVLECTKPRECPCPQSCHPSLPEYPIYEVPRLRKEKARELKGLGLLSITEIPDDYPLSVRQKERVEVAKTGNLIIKVQKIAKELANLEYPLHFLDYETYNPGIPWFDGYKPYQHIVFQYSLHILEKLESELNHIDFLGMGNGDPGIQLIEHLKKNVGESGSIIVWNKSFEVSRNNDLARMYPDYSDFLTSINDRVFDLMDIFNKGYYLHPDFHGSASIKSVLPVLVDAQCINYDLLPISKGDEAMMGWVRLMNGSLNQEDVERTIYDLLRYCELDTLAMVKIWEVLVQICRDED